VIADDELRVFVSRLPDRWRKPLMDLVAAIDQDAERVGLEAARIQGNARFWWSHGHRQRHQAVDLHAAAVLIEALANRRRR
tara:strand:- start:548 stop:790 length:243 start_codon:yes stop_codon:yes gene_type:complete